MIGISRGINIYFLLFFFLSQINYTRTGRVNAARSINRKVALKPTKPTKPTAVIQDET